MYRKWIIRLLKRVIILVIVSEIFERTFDTKLGCGALIAMAIAIDLGSGFIESKLRK